MKKKKRNRMSAKQRQIHKVSVDTWTWNLSHG
jgi:hypothetical protein